MNNIKVSTITPCYKMEKYLKLFLDELPNQTMFQEMEVVLDHNEPTKQELDWVNEFQSKHPGRLKHIITNPVVPIGTSMNRCISESSGEYLCIWNVDDLRCENSIELQVNKLEQGYDVCYGGFIIVNHFGAKKGKAIDQLYSHYNQKELQRGMYLGPFFCFKKSLLNESLLFDEQLKTGADFDLAIRLAKTGKCGYIPEYLGYYLDEGKGASTNGNGNQPIERTVIEMRYNILDKIEQQYVPYVKQRGYDIQNIIVNNEKISIERFK